MLSAKYKKLYLGIGLTVFVFLGAMLLAFAQDAYAQKPRSKPGPAPSSRIMDSRHRHDHAYPSRGHSISRLPRGYHPVVHRNSRYYFHGGVWYRPYGSYFTVVAPPFGLIVPFLPLYYSTIWVSGAPYFYANQVYYTRTTGGYMIVEAPKEKIVEAPVPEERLFIYPRKGQSEKKQSDDRYECHRWAVDQTLYDPTQPPESVPASQLYQKRADYQRAISACLDARGYTVK